MIIDASAFIDSRQIGRFQILVAILCAMVMLFDGLNTQVIGYLGPVLAKDWNLPSSALGPIFSAGLTGLMIGLLVIGPLSDKVGRKLAMVTSTVLFGCFTLLTAGAHGVPDLLFYRLMAGVGLGGALPNALALSGEYCPARRRATLVVIMFCGFSLGSILGGGLTAALVSRFGWRPVFLVCGALPLLLAPILIAVLPTFSAPPDYRFVSAPRATGLPVAQLFHSGRALGTLLLWLVIFMNLTVFFFLHNWLPTVLKGSGLATETAILVSTLMSAGGIGAGLSIGPLIDRFGPYPVLAVLYICGTILVASIGFVSTSLPAIIAVTVGAGFSVSGGQKSVNALAVIFYPSAVRSTGVGWALGVGRIGSIVGPLMGGWMMARGWSNVNIFEFASLPLLCAAAVVVVMGLRYSSNRIETLLVPALKLRHLSLAILGLAVIGAALSLLRAQESASRSVWDGVYTDQQAKRGEPKYHDYCADCHGDDLEGDAESPALSGAMFQTNWEGLPLGSLYQRIRRDMPLNKYVGTLSPSVNVDILAYILKVNRFPEGSAELSHAAEVLNQIRFESVKPARKR